MNFRARSIRWPRLQRRTQARPLLLGGRRAPRPLARPEPGRAGLGRKSGQPRRRGSAGRVQRGAHRAPAPGGFPGLPGRPGAERHQGARRRRGRDGHGAAGAARLVGADVAELPQRCRGVRAGRRRGRPGARDAGREDGGGREALLRGAVRDADAARALARAHPADQEAAAPRGRVRLRARVRRLVRRRGARRDPQHQPRVGGDLRRLPLRILARRAAAQEPAVLPAVRRAEGPRRGRPTA